MSVCLWTNLRYDPVTECWNWTGSRIEKGYGVIRFLGKTTYVHRLAMHVWRKFDLDSDLCVLHRCDNPSCFNPNHLFLGTRTDNNADMLAKGRASGGFKMRPLCEYGHPKTVLRNGYIERWCKTCQRRRNAARRRRTA